MTKTLVVSLGTNSYYAREARRLEWSCKKFGEEHRVYAAEYPKGCPTQKEIPMGYKPFLMLQAFEQGYDCVLWADSKITVIQPLDRLWEKIEKDGHFAIEGGWRVGQWASDDALRWLGITRKEAFRIHETSTAFFGLHKSRLPWLKEWQRSATDRIWNVPSRAPFKMKRDCNVMKQYGSRGEQPVASALFHRMGMKLTNPPSDWWAYEVEPTPGKQLVTCTRLPAKGRDKKSRTWTKNFWLPPDEK